METIALESVDFFQREWNCLEKHKGSDSMSRVVQQLLIRMTLDLVKAQLMMQVKLLIA